MVRCTSEENKFYKWLEGSWEWPSSAWQHWGWDYFAVTSWWPSWPSSSFSTSPAQASWGWWGWRHYHFQRPGPSSGWLNIFNWLLLVLWWTLALQSSPEALLIFFDIFSFSFAGLESVKNVYVNRYLLRVVILFTNRKLQYQAPSMVKIPVIIFLNIFLYFSRSSSYIVLGPPLFFKYRNKKSTYLYM